MDGSLSDSETLQVKRLTLQPTAISLGHLGEPRSLLALTQAIYGKIPPAYWILIPAVNFFRLLRTDLINFSGRPRSLSPYRQKIVDGNGLGATDHRLEVLRDNGAGAKPSEIFSRRRPGTGTSY